MGTRKNFTISKTQQIMCVTLRTLSAIPLFFLVICIASKGDLHAAPVPQDGNLGTASNLTANLLQVEFPLTSENESRLIESMERLSSRAKGTDRPLVILEFVTRKGYKGKDGELLGRGTTFERALGLARWLSGPKGSRIRSVAYLPKSICGHAVLVALGCEEIAIATDAQLGQAAIDEPSLDATVRQAYLDVAAKSTFPPAAILSLIDPSESLVKILFNDNHVEYVTAPQLAKRERTVDTQDEIQIVPANQLAVFVGHELRGLKWVAHMANDRDQLSQALKLSRPVNQAPAFDGPRVAMRIHLSGIMSHHQVNRVIRAIEEGLGKKDVNLIVIDVDSPGGNLNESLRLAQYIAGIDNDRVTFVSYISGSAHGDAALIPLASDMIFMHPSATLGGGGEATILPATCRSQKTQLQDFAKSVARSDGDILGCICPDMPLFEYNTVDGRLQINNPDWIVDDGVIPEWTQGAPISFKGGLSFERANQLGLATDNPISIEEVANRFGLAELPKEVRTNATEQFVEWLAAQGWLSMLLFFVGIVCLSAELSSPGMGIAGILSAICFLLFFWIHLFQGTVEWLEILLILGGVVCLALELFVLPGFGVFGVTGLILLAVGLLLAGQTFIFPTNEYQWQRTAKAVGQMGLIVFSLFGAAIVFRKQLANMPMIRWFALQPPKVDKELVEMVQKNEELRALIGWHGTTISRCNPSGKATINDRIYRVVSDGAWIDEDSEIEVVNIQENSLVVRPHSNVT
jgi:membrane-bound serine protease (ClpP class)